jgi:hypothetical protein
VGCPIWGTFSIPSSEREPFSRRGRQIGLCNRHLIARGWAEPAGPARLNAERGTAGRASSRCGYRRGRNCPGLSKARPSPGCERSRRWLLALSCGGDKPGPAIDPGQLDRGAQVAQRQAEDKFPPAHRRCGYHHQAARSPITAPGSWVWVITRFRVITQTQLTCMLAGQPALPATIRQRLAGEPDVY